MSWCPNDSSYLLTCGKDSRTICWDMISGEVVFGFFFYPSHILFDDFQNLTFTFIELLLNDDGFPVWVGWGYR